MYQTLLNQPPRIKPIQSLDELAAWTPANQQVHAASVPLQSRPLSHSPHPKVLICHDMANGYKDDAFAQTVIRPSENTAENYSFQHFPLIDEFVYFSHHRISIPPKQWVNAAHRNGVIVYATLITEWEGAVVETLKLIYGPEYDATPIITPSDTSSESTRPIYPAAKVSTFYIEKLVQLALFYGFEGWFINIECDLGEPHHAAAMREFVHLLTLAMRASALPNAKVIWYDSLTIEGKLKWQDRVTPENKPFFDACDGIFVNYTWKQSYPEETAKLVSSASGVDRRKDVFFGIDVWGRNTFGGGGFNVHKALREITKHGLSTALFAQAWTYEFLGPSQFNKADMRLMAWRTT
ncbi:glycoside hydrolase [Obelidium mucronatum]|nr:glycoside hydrolase [Obelidium mucronatum]